MFYTFWRSYRGGETFPGSNILWAKLPGAKPSLGEKVFGRNYRGRNLPWAKQSLGETTGGETVVGRNSRWAKMYWAKLPGAKQSLGETVIGRKCFGRNYRGRNCRWAKLYWGKLPVTVTETSVAPLSEHPIANRCTCGHRNARKGIGMKILMDAEARAGFAMLPRASTFNRVWAVLSTKTCRTQKPGRASPQKARSAFWKLLPNN